MGKTCKHIQAQHIFHIFHICIYDVYIVYSALDNSACSHFDNDDYIFLQQLADYEYKVPH